MNTPLSGRAHGKLILFGEHAAVYGYPAVGLGIPMPLSVELDEGGSVGLTFPEMTAEESDVLAAAIDRAIRIEPAIADLAGSLRVRSGIPPARGFGSSGALCAATARALVSAISRSAAKIDNEERVWRLAHAMEGAFHGTPSGIDTGLALIEGLGLLRPRPPELPALSMLYGCPFALIAGACRAMGAPARLSGRFAVESKRGIG